MPPQAHSAACPLSLSHNGGFSTKRSLIKRREAALQASTDQRPLSTSAIRHKQNHNPAPTHHVPTLDADAAATNDVRMYCDYSCDNPVPVFTIPFVFRLSRCHFIRPRHLFVHRAVIFVFPYVQVSAWVRHRKKRLFIK